MTFDYAGIRDNTVDTLIKEFGSSGTLKVSAEGAYDPDTGVSTPTETSYTIYLVEVEDIVRQKEDLLQEEKLKRLYISPKDMTVVPTNGDIIVWNSKSYPIKECTPISPAGVDVLYDVLVQI